MSLSLKNLYDNLKTVGTYVTASNISKKKADINISAETINESLKEKKIITTAPASVDVIDYFADYLTTDEGRLVMEEIVKRS